MYFSKVALKFGLNLIPAIAFGPIIKFMKIIGFLLNATSTLNATLLYFRYRKVFLVEF